MSERFSCISLVFLFAMTVAIIANYLGPKLGIGQYIDQLIQPLVEELRSKSVDVLILGRTIIRLYNKSPGIIFECGNRLFEVPRFTLGMALEFGVRGG